MVWLPSKAGGGRHAACRPRTPSCETWLSRLMALKGLASWPEAMFSWLANSSIPPDRECYCFVWVFAEPGGGVCHSGQQLPAGQMKFAAWSVQCLLRDRSSAQEGSWGFVSNSLPAPRNAGADAGKEDQPLVQKHTDVMDCRFFFCGGRYAVPLHCIPPKPSVTSNSAHHRASVASGLFRVSYLPASFCNIPFIKLHAMFFCPSWVASASADSSEAIRISKDGGV